jgi:hypothetical protein
MLLEWWGEGGQVQGLWMLRLPAPSSSSQAKRQSRSRLPIWSWHPCGQFSASGQASGMQVSLLERDLDQLGESEPIV